MCEGIVLGRYGGTVKQMYLPFFLGLGGRISSGKQWFPWIHADDVAGIYAYAIENDAVTVSDFSNRCSAEFTPSHTSTVLVSKGAPSFCSCDCNFSGSTLAVGMCNMTLLKFC